VLEEVCVLDKQAEKMQHWTKYWSSTVAPGLRPVHVASIMQTQLHSKGSSYIIHDFTDIYHEIEYCLWITHSSVKSTKLLDFYEWFC